MRSFYNDNDPYCCAWLSNLMDENLITPGAISDTPIQNLDPAELAGFQHVHFFAGLGGWERACQLADWGDRPIWTGSAPCQPFSAAGAQRGTDDPRHLWPDFFRLVRALRPALVVGEQVSGRAGYGWFDGVASDLEGEGYACRAVDIPACAIDAPHRRNRLYWVALADAEGESEREPQHAVRPVAWERPRPDVGGRVCGHRGALADAASGQLPQPLRQQEARDGPRPAGEAPAVGHADESGPCEEWLQRSGQFSGLGRYPQASAWDDHIWITGADGKARRVPGGQSQSGVRGVAHGLPAGVADVCPSTIPLLTHGEAQRVSKLRALGNAIVPQLAAEVLRALKPLKTKP